MKYIRNQANNLKIKFKEREVLFIIAKTPCGENDFVGTATVINETLKKNEFGFTTFDLELKFNQGDDWLKYNRHKFEFHGSFRVLFLYFQ